MIWIYFAFILLNHLKIETLTTAVSMAKHFLSMCLFAALAAAADEGNSSADTAASSSDINVYQLLKEIEDLETGVP